MSLSPTSVTPPISLANQRMISYVVSPDEKKRGLIYYIDTGSGGTPTPTRTTNQRGTWKFLTRGITKLIEAFAVFCAGIIHREKTGVPLRVRFVSQHIPQDHFHQFVKFQKINERSSAPLKESEKIKALQIMHRIVQTTPSTETTGDATREEKLKPFLNLLDKSNRKVSLNQFLEEDWKTLDLIDFELAQESFDNLVSVFNSEWMHDSGLHAIMQNDYKLDYYEAVVAENLSLTLAYIEGMDGKEISLPVFDKSIGCYRDAKYKIMQTRLGDALPCYILESDDPGAHPWFVVRGTQPYTALTPGGKELRTGSLESILADSLDHECISRNIINKALVKRPIVNEDGKLIEKESLSDIFRKWHNEGKEVNLCGHSLGGTLVNALTVEFYGQVRTAYSFSGAGVSQEMAEKWDDLKANDSTASYSTKLVNFDYEGDFIPSGGKRLIGNHFAMTSVEKDTLPGLYDSHVLSHLNRDFQIQKVDIERENNKLSRKFMERVRIAAGKCFRFLLSCFNRKYIPDWWTKREQYKAHAAFERVVREDHFKSKPVYTHSSAVFC